MIKISRSACPAELTDELKTTLTEKFISSKDNVWAQPFIKTSLLNMSQGKCCFCESKLGEEGKYLHVEHFHHKDAYPKEVVEWKNLLPSCVRCNVNKGTHDTVNEPIIDPTEIDPREHLVIVNYRFKSKMNSTLGRKTIEVIYLNDSDQLVKPRFDIANKALEALDVLLDKAVEYKTGISRSTKRKNIIVNGLKALLREAHPSSQYSAIVATAIMRDTNYLELKTILLEEGYWDEVLMTLEAEIRETSLYT